MSVQRAPLPGKRLRPSLGHLRSVLKSPIKHKIGTLSDEEEAFPRLEWNFTLENFFLKPGRDILQPRMALLCSLSVLTEMTLYSIMGLSVIGRPLHA